MDVSFEVEELDMQIIEIEDITIENGVITKMG